MLLARPHSIALVGVQGHPVEIEVDIENGLVGLMLVGLPDTALREARDRIRSAVVNSKEHWPLRRITVGLSPASLPKRGSGFDIGIAVAILAAAGAAPVTALQDIVFIGELGLDGRLRAVPGVLPAAAAAARAGFPAVAVPAQNAPEASLVPGLRVLAVSSLGSLLAWLRAEATARGRRPGRSRARAECAGGLTCPRTTGPGGEQPGLAAGLAARRAAAGRGGSGAGFRGRGGPGARSCRARRPAGRAGVEVSEGGAAPVPAPAGPAGLPGGGDQAHGRDLADVVGQPTARRAAEICAAGGHHLLLLGPPGAGKTMLAERLPTILPRLEPAAALERSEETT